MQTIKMIVWSLISLIMFLVLNYIMHLPAIGMQSSDLMRTNLMAIGLFGIPLLLTVFRLRVGFYFLALIQLIYTVGYFSAAYQVTMLSHAHVLSKIAVMVVVIIALLINVYWFMLAWKFRKATTKARTERYMKYRK
ncbi:hypothetical protein BGL40_05915 [Fructilactobacillus sanfranciscensis]|uniref:hypothetical protein n=1 Tax=Fructilactobacillus sanfranciscensis TaxID=1625 RepID=UPI000CD45880|nr:hypothetical protein [Fructilactobacillus sanfranciscensis]POH15260.1 hypothetical protein BGL40_05915 [Fructilactobacillus sanfranciscensis]